MRILDKNGNELKSIDETLGYLMNETIIAKHHEAVEAVEEQGHFETVKVYPNGGKDVKWVVDVEAVEAKESFDEYEDILRFVPFTEKELTEREIAELKQKLFDTDYIILKIVEGAATLKDCSESIKNRAAWRQRINELEESLKGE